MVHFVWLIGVFIAVWSIAVLFKPVWMRQAILLFRKGKLIYVNAGLKVFIGIVFLILARDCNLPGVIIAVGVLMTLGPILFCLLPYAKIQRYMNWWIAQPFWMYRTWAVLAALLGGLIMYAGVPQ